MAVFLVDMGLGLYGFFFTKSTPLPESAALLIFAIVFIAGLVFYEKHGAGPVVSLLGGAVAGFGFSFVFVFLVGGFQFALKGGISEIGLEQVTSSIAASMIISVIMLKIISYRFHDFVY
ncbi:MAG: heat-shock protein [Methanosarcinaceae archaeon]|nr:heat-shock protein [Methanosarcinaceae archaeon]